MNKQKQDSNFAKGLITGLFIFSMLLAILIYIFTLSTNEPKPIYLYDQFKNNCIADNNKFVEGTANNGYCLINGIKQTYTQFITQEFTIFEKACNDGTIGTGKIIQRPDCGDLCSMETSQCGTLTFKNYISGNIL